MKRFISFFLLIVFISPSFGQGSKPRIAVLGSSTAYGQFNGAFPRDSGWVAKLEKYYKDLGLIDGIDNYARSGADCYDGMPTGYTPPVGRPNPYPGRNITAAINHIPKPSFVIVNYPSNKYGTYSDEEIIFCLQTIKDYANANGVECYITTTQPRDKMLTPVGDDGLCRLLHLRNLIMNTFGEYAINFYSDIADEGCQIISDYSLGDGVHLNPAGHTVLENIVINKNILLGTVPIHFIDFNAVAGAEKIILKWRVSRDASLRYFNIMKSTDGQSFQEIGSLSNDGNDEFRFTDASVTGDICYYRIDAVDALGATNSSKIISVRPEHAVMKLNKLYQTRQKLMFELANVPERSLRVQVWNINGQVALNTRKTFTGGLIEQDISSLPGGIYVVMIASGNQHLRRTFFKD